MSELEPLAIEILAEDLEQKPLAFSLDPDFTSTERLRMIINAQINRVDPKIIFYNVAGIYEEISDSEFVAIKKRPPKEQKRFTEELLAAFKAPDTWDIIISEPRPKK